MCRSQTRAKPKGLQLQEEPREEPELGYQRARLGGALQDAGSTLSRLSKAAEQKGTGLPPRTVDENLPAGAEDMGLIPGPGRFHMLQDK